MKKVELLCALLMLPLMQGCVAYYGGWGYGHGWGGWGWHHGGHWHTMDVRSGGHSASADALAHDYNISERSAAQILNVTEGNISPEMVSALNLSSADVASISQLQMPSQDALHKIAAYLGEDLAKIEALAADFFKTVNAQVGDINSPYWHDCMSTGHWATPQNQDCRQTYWQGCSPAMGATSCESVGQ